MADVSIQRPHSFVNAKGIFLLWTIAVREKSRTARDFSSVASCSIFVGAERLIEGLVWGIFEQGIFVHPNVENTNYPVALFLDQFGGK
ncbi:hypothetical protein [Sulfitobacter sp.]|uniref:hypothetical protein n=1 Tax=Sulfitobacter sp. TaxID=1903071 RepID=UPI0030016A7E